MSDVANARKAILRLRTRVTTKIRETKKGERYPHNFWYDVAVSIQKTYEDLVTKPAYREAFKELAEEEKRSYRPRHGALASSPFCRFILDADRLKRKGRGDSRINRVSAYVLFGYHNGLTGQRLREKLIDQKEAGVKLYLRKRRSNGRPVLRR